MVDCRFCLRQLSGPEIRKKKLYLERVWQFKGKIQYFSVYYNNIMLNLSLIESVNNKMRD